MSRAVVRGGQLNIHNLRMLKQKHLIQKSAFNWTQDSQNQEEVAQKINRLNLEAGLALAITKDRHEKAQQALNNDHQSHGENYQGKENESYGGRIIRKGLDDRNTAFFYGGSAPAGSGEDVSNSIHPAQKKQKESASDPLFSKNLPKGRGR